MNTVRIQVPCRRFTVRVTLGHAEGLSRFEEYVLRTIAAGSAKVEEVAATLGLPQSVVLDVCVDLLRAGYVLLHHGDAAIEVVPAVRDAMGDPLAPRSDWARQLAPAASPAPLEYDLLQDLVSGSIFPAVSALPPGRDWLLCPEDTALGELASVPKAALLEAAARLMRRIVERRGERETGPLSRRGIRVTDVAVVGLGAGSDRVISSPAMVTAEVVRRRSYDGDERPNLVIVGPPELGGGVRRQIASKLVQMWDDGVARGPDQFFTRLADRLLATETLEDDRDLESLPDPTPAVAALSDAVARIPDALDEGDEAIQSLHEELFKAERAATAGIDRALVMEASASLIVGAAAHQAMLLEAITKAAHQVVIASPSVGQLATNKDLREALIDAVGRGVRVHLAWGVDRSANFEKEFVSASRELLELLHSRAQRAGGLFVARRAAGLHANFFSCDMAWAAVSTFNFLHRGPDWTQMELGVRIEGPKGEASIATAGPSSEQGGMADRRKIAAKAICETIGWIRAVTPDHQLRPLISDEPALEGRRLPAPSMEVGEAIEAPGDQGIWHGSFQRRLKVLEERSRRLGAIVEPVFDGKHRDLLIVALRTAQERVVVSSRNLGAGLLSDAISELIRDAIGRGVTVTVYHADLSDWSDDLQRRRQELRSLGVTFSQRDVHAKVLICDEWVVVTSFSFLSWAGYYDQQRRARHELGVRVVERRLADEVADTLGRAPIK